MYKQQKPDAEYTPRDIFDEDIRVKRQAIPPKKIPSRLPTPAKCKVIDETSVTLGRYTPYTNFLKLAPDLKAKYLMSLFEKYPGIGNKEIRIMFGISKRSTSNIIQMCQFPTHHGRKTKAAEENSKRFLKEICGIDEISNTTNFDAISVTHISFVCDTKEQLISAIKRYGISGKVKVHIEKI